MNAHEYILTLLQQETLSDSEIEFLAAHKAHDPSDPLWETAAEQFAIRMKELDYGTPSKEAKETLERILRRIGKPEQNIAPVHRVQFLKTAWFKYAAAVIILITGIAIYFSVYTSQPEPAVVQNVPPASGSGSDIAPGFNRAILTLSNGQKITLDSAASETIIDGTLSIKNTNGQLLYGANGQPIPSRGGVDGHVPSGTEGAMLPGRGGFSTNTMTTPRGGQYQLTLSDGTRVWLNAASSITYPTAFTNKTREVSITGEAYFEVAKNAKQPFIVNVSNKPGTLPIPSVGGVARGETNLNKDHSGPRAGVGLPENATYQITVLGTSFNVNSYDNEPFKTSLAEGSVKVQAAYALRPEEYSEGGKASAAEAGAVLKPKQAFTNGKVTTTNIAKDIAWKNGSFYFEGTSFQELAKQLERWYDIEIKYVGNPPVVKLRGEMDMGVKLSGVCRFLNEVGIATEIKGKTLIISKAQQ